MNKAYVIVPLAALLAFGGVYWKSERAYSARVAEEKRAEVARKQAMLAEEAAARAEARKLAEAAGEQRRLERLERERIEAERKQARADAEERRLLALENERKQRMRLARLRAELDLAEAAMARVEERTIELREERHFLAGYVQQAEENRRAAYRILEKIEALEQAGTPADKTLPRKG